MKASRGHGYPMIIPIRREVEADSGLVLLHTNPVTSVSLARVISAALGLAGVRVAASVLELEEALGPEPLLLIVSREEIDLARMQVERFPWLRLVVLTPSVDLPLVEAMAATPGLNNLVVWPSFATLPRAWELALAARDSIILSELRSRLPDILTGVVAVGQWQPTTTADKDTVVAEVQELALRAGAQPRLAERVSASCHELLMNAMYDAPLDAEGRPRYAADRTRPITLEPEEIPTCRLATDGNLLLLEVTDPFGGLQRDHIFEALLRCMRQGSSAEAGRAVLNTEHGGAGLGLYTVYSACVSLFLDAEPFQRTRVTAVFDLTLRTRELRGLGASIHLNITPLEALHDEELP